MKRNLLRAIPWFTLLAPMLALLAAMFCAMAFAQPAPPAPATRPAFGVARPKVPILAWDVPVGHMARWQSRGVNVLVGAGLEGRKDQAELDAWAGEAAARGLWVIVNPLASRPYPNLYAFLLPDEMDAKQADKAIPKWDGLTPAQIKPLFDAFRAIDPAIPVFMSLSGAKITTANRLAYYKSIAPFCDLWMEDGYPRNMNADRYNEALWPGQACKVLKAAAPAKPLIAMIEVDDQNLWNSPLGRGPTAAEVAESLRQAAANGADGRGVFSHYFSDAGGWAGWDRTSDEVAAVLTAEFAKLNPPPPTPVPPADPAIVVLQRQVDALATKLAAVQAQAEQTQAQLRAAASILATTQPSGGR